MLFAFEEYKAKRPVDNVHAKAIIGLINAFWIENMNSEMTASAPSPGHRHWTWSNKHESEIKKVLDEETGTLFEYFDKNNDGAIDKKEVKRFMTKICTYNKDKASRKN